MIICDQYKSCVYIKVFIICIKSLQQSFVFILSLINKLTYISPFPNIPIIRHL